MLINKNRIKQVKDSKANLMKIKIQLKILRLITSIFKSWVKAKI